MVDQGGETANPLDMVADLEQSSAQLPKFEPAVRGVAQRAVVEVEAVDVDVDFCHGRPPAKDRLNMA